MRAHRAVAAAALGAVVAVCMAGVAAAAAAPCSGLKVGTSPDRADVVQDGFVLADWAFGRPHDGLIASADERVTTFYFRFTGRDSDKGLPVKALYLNHTDPDTRHDFIEPQLQGPMSSESPTVTDTSELSVSYNCYGRGGITVLWLTLVLDGGVAGSQCSATGAKGGSGSGDVYVRFMWRKFCAHELRHRAGLAVGTQPGTANVVNDGAVADSWSPSSHTAEVSSTERTSTFYVSTTDDSRQVVGGPRLEGVFQSRMHATLSGPALHGGTATSDSPLSFTVTYHCDPTSKPSQTFLTLTMNLCDARLRPEQCTTHHASAYEPLVVQWTKNCVADADAPSAARAFLAAFLLVAVFGCAAGAFFKYHYVGSRGIEVLPFVDHLRAFAHSVAEAFTVTRRKTARAGGYMRANMSEEDALHAAGDEEGGYQVDGSVMAGGGASSSSGGGGGSGGAGAGLSAGIASGSAADGSSYGTM